ARRTSPTSAIGHSAITAKASSCVRQSSAPQLPIAGIRTVEVSTNGGKSWAGAKLGDDLGRYAFRTWSFPLDATGAVKAMAKATNVIGQTQTADPIQNPAGYHHNVIQTITLTVT